LGVIIAVADNCWKGRVGVAASTDGARGGIAGTLNAGFCHRVIQHAVAAIAIITVISEGRAVCIWTRIGGTRARDTLLRNRVVVESQVIAIARVRKLRGRAGGIGRTRIG